MRIPDKEAAAFAAGFDALGSDVLGASERHALKTNILGHDMISRYAYDGLRLYLRLAYEELFNYAEMFEPGNLPADCPWPLESPRTVAAEISGWFKPIAAEIPSAIKLLQRCCRILAPMRHEGSWYLLYFFDISEESSTGKKMTLWAGGAPESKPLLSAMAIEQHWQLPQSLRRFYSIHNGFGPLQDPTCVWISDHIFPSSELFPLSYVAPEDIRQEYDPADLLQFHCDAGSNGQLFYRRAKEEREPVTVSWDHEGWTTYGEKPFFEFFETYVRSQLIEL